MTGSQAQMNPHIYAPLSCTPSLVDLRFNISILDRIRYRVKESATIPQAGQNQRRGDERGEMNVGSYQENPKNKRVA